MFLLVVTYTSSYCLLHYKYILYIFIYLEKNINNNNNNKSESKSTSKPIPKKQKISNQVTSTSSMIPKKKEFQKKNNVAVQNTFEKPTLPCVLLAPMVFMHYFFFLLFTAYNYRPEPQTFFFRFSFFIYC
jgi:hypothetical protein